jgi:transaldolase/glucose-6-phosphate isomerase
VYSDCIYVDELIAADTVNTMPPQTLVAFKDHGKPSAKLIKNMETAQSTLAEIAACGVNLDRITDDLIEDGVVKFADSFDALLAAIAMKLKVETRA